MERWGNDRGEESELTVDSALKKPCGSRRDGETVKDKCITHCDAVFSTNNRWEGLNERNCVEMKKSL